MSNTVPPNDAMPRIKSNGITSGRSGGIASVPIRPRKGAGSPRPYARGSRTPGRITFWNGRPVVTGTPKLIQRLPQNASRALCALLDLGLVTRSLARHICKLSPCQGDQRFLATQAIEYAKSIGLLTATVKHLP